jgi:hypothetical protein
MFVVLACNKYSPKQLRVADIGDSDPDTVVKGINTMECIVCGPCSHVEFTWTGYLSVLSQHDNVDSALKSADDLAATKEYRFR